MQNFQVFEKQITSILEKDILLLNQTRLDQTSLKSNFKKLNLRNAIEFLNSNGFNISKSTIYKLTSKNEIPHSKFCSKLVFDQVELETWILSKLAKVESNEIDFISKSAINKLKNR